MRAGGRRGAAVNGVEVGERRRKGEITGAIKPIVSCLVQIKLDLA